MERRIAVKENIQLRSDSTTPLSKSLGSVVKIDAITIDLSGAMENHHGAMKCDHFSIRGYAAEMRKKDMSVCLPFAFEDKQRSSEEQTSILPPLRVAKFRWWCCQNCLQEIGVKIAAEQIGLVPDSCQGDIKASTSGSKDEICPSSSDIKASNKEKKGHETGTGNNVNQRLTHPGYNLIDYSKPCSIRGSQADGLDALRSKSSGLVGNGEPCGRSGAGANIKNLVCMDRGSAEIFPLGIPTFADDEQRILSMGSEICNSAGRSIKGNKIAIPSFEHEERNGSHGILDENINHDQHCDNSSGLVRQKTQKVRLLTELLGSKRDAKNDLVRTDGARSTVIPNAPAGLDSVSSLQGHVAAQESLKKHSVGPKGKRKLSHDKDWEPLKLICSSKLTKKAKDLKVDAEISNASNLIADSESEDASNVLPIGVRSQWSPDTIDRSPPLSKRKNKQTRVDSGYYPLVSQQEIVSKTSNIIVRNAEKHCAAVDGGFPQSARDLFSSRGKEPYIGSSLSPQPTERKSGLYKGKNKFGAGKVLSMPHRNSGLGECSVMRKNLNRMETEPETAGKGLDLNSYATTERNKKSHIAQNGVGIGLSFPPWKDTARENHHNIKNIIHVGESSFSHKSAPELIYRKGLHCGLNEKFTNHRTPPLHEMQNRVPWAGDGSSSQHGHLDFSGSHNSTSTIDIQKQGNDDIPMEIVELMARNQFERCRHEAERNYFFSGQIKDKKTATSIGIPREHRNGLLGSLHEDNHLIREPPAGMGMATTSENLGPIKRNPINCFPEVHGNHYNVGQFERNSAFAGGLSVLPQCKEIQSSGVQRSGPGSFRNGTSENCQWKGDKVASRFDPANIPPLEGYNSYQIGLQQSEEAQHVRSLMMPNLMPNGTKIPQKYETQLINFETHSRYSDTHREGRMMGDQNLTFLHLNANNFEHGNKNFHSESFRTSSENPFICKHGGIDLNTKVPGSLDLNTNETIPAMQLLSLMDAGMQSSSSLSLDGKSKGFTKPFVPCVHHPKVSLDGTSKILENPLFTYDHHSKEFFGRGSALYSESSRQTPSIFHGKNHLSEKACECSPAAGSFASLSKSDGILKRGAVFTGQVPSRSEERGKALVQKQGRRKNLAKEGLCTVNRNPADFTLPTRGNEYMIIGANLKLKKKVSARIRYGLVNVDGRRRQRVAEPTGTKERLEHHTS